MSTTANNYHLPIFTSNFHTRVNKFKGAELFL